MSIDIQATMSRIPTVARLYYGGSPSRRYLRASTNAAHYGEPLVHRSHVIRELERLQADADKSTPAAVPSSASVGDAGAGQATKEQAK